VVVAGVPFVDALNTMLDPSLPLTVGEYEEWGNPEEKQYYEYIKSYAPYENVAAKAYPAMLITAGLNDPRVSYWEAAKWCAKLRALKTDDHLLLLKTNMGSGHFGASGRYEYLKETAFNYAFVLSALRMEGQESRQ
jgi:oligopeptidase B